MNIEFDLAKGEKIFVTAKIWPDTRKDYGEARYIALGYIDERLHSLGFHGSRRCAASD